MAASKAKQYLSIGNKSILEHTIDVFLAHPQISDIVVVLHPDDIVFQSLDVASNAKVTTVIGGAQRVDSVLAGLKALNNNTPDSYVLVHDAARPCVCPKDISKLINTCVSSQLKSRIAGAILAVPVADTIKSAKSEKLKPHKHMSTIDTTVDRSSLWQAQTPQMFIANELIDAIESAIGKGHVITDESSAMEFSGKLVGLVEGQSSNIKITRPSDLALATFYLKQFELQPEQTK